MIDYFSFTNERDENELFVRLDHDLTERSGGHRERLFVVEQRLVVVL